MKENNRPLTAEQRIRIIQLALDADSLFGLVEEVNKMCEEKDNIANTLIGNEASEVLSKEPNYQVIQTPKSANIYAPEHAGDVALDNASVQVNIVNPKSLVLEKVTHPSDPWAGTEVAPPGTIKYQ